jgi:P-type Cu2+ transporter
MEHQHEQQPRRADAKPGYPEHPELPRPAAGEGDAPHHGGHEHDGGHEHHGGHEDHGGHAHHGSHEHHGGHDKHAGHSVEMFRDRFWLSLILTIPTVLWGHMLPRLTGWHAPEFPGSELIAPVFGSVVFFYGGRVFLQGGVRELRDRLPGMMTLISLAILVAFLFSAAVTLGYPGMPLWEELATLVSVMLLGHWIEMRSIFQAQGALRELSRLLPDNALRIVGQGTEEVPIAMLQEGDLVLVRPGAAVLADGSVESGESDVNEALLTGESRPVRKSEGSEVIAGTVNGAGSLRVRVRGTGERTALARIMRLVEQAQTSRSRAQALADRAAFLLTLVALGAATATAIVWLALGAGGSFTVERVVTVLVIACPHALGLAVPLVVAISITLGARGGLLVRDRRGLEEARNLDVVVFDKTGTLTLGEHRVVAVATVPDLSREDALRLAGAVERDSEHPVGQAIVASAREADLDIPAATGFEALAGHGVRARVEGREVHVGGPNLLRRLGHEAPATLRAAVARFERAAQSAVYLVAGDRIVAAFAIADAIRPEAREAVDRLHRIGIEVALLTGDAQVVADSVGAELGIDTIFAEVLPEQKAERIRALQQHGRRVAMVGDGVNDAPALVTADVGIAIGAGTDVAVEAGDVVLVRSDPRDVARIIRLSRASYRKMLQNLWWAAGYNIVAIPLAAGVLAAWGFLLHPAVAALLMSASTVIVALNAQLLRRQEV